jgi:serine protease AprX
MQKLAFSIVCLLLVQLLNAQNAWSDKVAPLVLESVERGGKTDVLVAFHGRADLSAAAQIKGKNAKAAFVYNTLISLAQERQQRAVARLRAENAHLNSIWLVNALAVGQADAATIQWLAELPEVRAIAPDPAIALDYETADPLLSASRDGIEWGVSRINAPMVWAMGFTGQGITIGGADTGYEWQHPAIKGHYRGYNALTDTINHNYNWFDAISGPTPLNGDSLNPCGYNTPAPCDDNSHGTHTMGTMAGDDGQGNQIGVAPGSKWVACRNMERGNGTPSTYLGCFQWFLAPTDVKGENANPARAPHVINNSWYCSTGEGCTDVTVDDLLRQAIIALKASGVFVVVSNGNFGGGGCNTTYGPPAYFEESFSIGATRDDDRIAGFSSRGPVTIDASNRIKPNVSAPGQGIRSSVPGGAYANFSGTSMSGPHVAGLVALVLSANPDLIGEVATVEQIIQQTARFSADTFGCTLDPQARPNNTYGWGIVDARAAVEMAIAQSAVNQPDNAAPLVTFAPNPAHTFVQFNIQSEGGAMRLQLSDATGRVVRLVERQEAPGSSALTLSVEGLPAGVYVWNLEIGTSGKATGGKLVVY